jgi:hypothetical protein
MSHELNTLQMALLSVCRDAPEPLHSLHVHAEDWLARPIEADELAGALAAMARAGLIHACRRVASEWVVVPADSTADAELRFRATPAGAEAAAAAWRRYFSE